MQDVKYLIVGQGIAGSMVAWELLKKKEDFLIISSQTQASSSEIAGGIINPVNLRKYKLVQLGDKYMAACNQTYREIEKSLGDKIFHLIDIVKYIDDGLVTMEVNERLRDYVGHTSMDETIGVKRSDILTLNKTGYLDARLFLTLFRTYLIRCRKLIQTDFEHGQLTIADSIWHNKIRFQRVIFCEGAHAYANPWLKSLPFAHNKGELIEIEAPLLKLDKIIRDEVFILPLGQNRFRIGATYNHRTINRDPSDEGRNYLTEKLKKIIDVPYKVIGHDAGIRPSTKDRMPMLGALPEYPNIVVFNGLGSRGFLMAPYWANHLVMWLTGETAQLNPVVDVNRFLE
ncbi:MAG: FAD-dependent oxidoreductase [Breznakibacter sp.]